MCPLLPSLEQTVAEVEVLAGAGAGALQTHYVHVTEVTLPMLCSYMSRWWRWGPEGHPAQPHCTSVVPQLASGLLGNILRIIHNHVGTCQGDWMKHLAGIVTLNNSVHVDVSQHYHFSDSCHSFLQCFLSQSYVMPALSY